jgi:hypothetical protein
VIADRSGLSARCQCQLGVKGIVCDRWVLWIYLLEDLIQLLFCPAFLFGGLGIDV